MVVDATGISINGVLKLPSYSRYRKSAFFPNLSGSIGPLNQLLPVPLSNDDTYHRVKSGEEFRLDLISHRIYGNQFYWWIIALANDIRDFISYPVVGQVLRIPNIVTVSTYYLNM